MFEKCETTRKQGDLGLAFAIFKLTEMGYTISLPLTDNNAYDLLIEKEGALSSVQVKTSQHRNKYGKFRVQLQRVRHNKNENIIHKFDRTQVGYVFILTSDKQSYFIPSPSIIAKSNIDLTDFYNQFMV